MPQYQPVGELGSTQLTANRLVRVCNAAKAVGEGGELLVVELQATEERGAQSAGLARLERVREIQGVGLEDFRLPGEQCVRDAPQQGGSLLGRQLLQGSGGSSGARCLFRGSHRGTGFTTFAPLGGGSEERRMPDARRASFLGRASRRGTRYHASLDAEGRAVAAIDGILRIVVEQGGDQLVLSTDAVPLALAGDRKLRLTMPATSQGSLRALLGDLIRGAQAGADGGVSVGYDAPDLGAFLVEFEGSLRDGDNARARLSLRGNDRAPAVATPPEAGEREAGEREPASRHRAEPAAAPTPALTSTTPLQRVLERAIADGASDVHACEGERPSFRIDGRLSPSGLGSVSVASWLSPQQLEQVRAGRAIDLGIDVGGQRFRANFYLSLGGPSAAIRALRRDVPNISALGMPPQVAQLHALPHGLVIVCGYTGSGKSTTLASLAAASLANDARLCVTLEDPIEYRVPPGGHGSIVRQREVGQHVADFAAGLRDALREDPDTLLIGEMRDRETIALALTAAETGHLVMSSLHSRTTASAIERIIDAFPSDQQRQVRLQLADSLRAVVAQRLLPRARGAGRVVAVEVLRVTRAVAHMIREGRTEQIATALHSGKEAGMLALERHLADLVRSGAITLETARASTHNLDVFQQFLSNTSA